MAFIFRSGIGVLLICMLCAGGVLWWWQKSDRATETADITSLKQLASISASKPTVVVLPFTRTDPFEDTYFVDGITVGINQSLSKLPGLFVIARGSAFVYGHRQGIGIKRVADELDVSYIVQGEVNKTDADAIVIKVQLIDGQSGKVTWHKRLERPLAGLFQLQGEIAIAIATQLGLKLSEQDKTLINRLPTKNLDAYDIFLRGQALYSHTSKETAKSAQILFQEAIKLDPDFARAISSLALTHADAAFMGWSDNPEVSLRQARALAEQAAAIDDSLAQTNWALAYTYLSQKQHAQSIDLVEKAIELDPNYADAYGLLAFILNYAGRPEIGSRLVGKAIRLNPHASAGYFYVLGQAYYLLDRFDEAIGALRTSLERNHSNLFGHLYLAASYSRLQQQDEAEWVVAEILSIFPGFSLQNWVQSQPYRAQEHIERLHKDLRLAGLQ